MITEPYRMTISRMTVDKLGVKLYDRVALVIAELVANGYDADATEVTIEAPMDTILASLRGREVIDTGYKIIVRDNGFGMTPEVINPFYLKVGGERRLDAKRGNFTPKFKRRVMGRKGVGKLAPFGICGTIEVISSGGDVISGKDAKGHKASGYLTAHFTMNRQAIVSDVDVPYEPDIGDLDRTISPTHGTTLVLSNFAHRRVPDLEEFARQLGQRFGIASDNWSIRLIDSNKVVGTEGSEKIVGGLHIDKLEATVIHFRGPSSKELNSSQTEAVNAEKAKDYRAENEKGEAIAATNAGFWQNGYFYPVLGWVAYSKQPYRDDLMAGIRIYCRGKIAAQTYLFNRKSGFTGEFQVRSYLVGELQADWLDQDDDLIQTDRRDILWSDDLGQAFEAWGKKIVELVGNMSRDPVKRQTWAQFLQASDIRQKIADAYPGDEWSSIRNTTLHLAQRLGERLDREQVQDSTAVDTIVQLSLMLGPHVELDQRLNEAGDDDAGPLQVIAGILRTARVAELSSYGLIADKRIKVIDRVDELKNDSRTREDALQASIDAAPWLIDAQWSPISANATLDSLRAEFAKHYERATKKKIDLTPFSKDNKRPDFVLSSQDGLLQIIEIKRPDHKLKNAEWERIQTYIDQMTTFLGAKGNKRFLEIYRDFRVTLVCDQIALTGVHSQAFRSLLDTPRLEHVTWGSFLSRTKQAHQAFLAEAERQRKLALKP